MSDVIRLRKSEYDWLEDYRSLQMNVAAIELSNGSKYASYDLERYRNMSISDLVEDCILHSLVDLKAYVKKQNYVI